MRRLMVGFTLLACAVLPAIPGARQSTNGSALSAGALKGLEFRSLGPALATGRVADVQIDPRDSNVWWVANDDR